MCGAANFFQSFLNKLQDCGLFEEAKNEVRTQHTQRGEGCAGWVLRATDKAFGGGEDLGF